MNKQLRKTIIEDSKYEERQDWVKQQLETAYDHSFTDYMNDLEQDREQ